MKVIGIVAGVLLGLFLLWGISQVAASESGEVVVLTTSDAEGEPMETRLWVVDLDGLQYLRAGQPTSGWAARMQERPEAEVARGGRSGSYRAEPHPELRDPVNDLMRAKYGWADQYIDLLYGRDDALPFRLVPR